jgi:hypothetical protein
MRTRLLTLVVLGLALLAPRAHAGDGEVLRTPEQAARAAFEALKSDNKSAYEALLPPATELQAMLEAALATLEETQRKDVLARLEKRGGYPAMLAEMRTKALQRFERAHTESAQAFEWSKAAFVGLDQSRQRVREDGPLDLREVRFFVRVEDDLHEFATRDALFVAKHWCLPEGVRYRGAVGGATQREIEDLEKDNDRLRTQLEALRDRMAEQERRAVERDDAHRRQLDELEVRHNEQMRESDKRSEAERDAERRALRSHLDTLQDHLKEERTKSTEMLHEVQTHVAALQENAARLAFQRDEEKSHRQEVEARLQAQQKRERTVAYALKELVPALVPALSHDRETVRMAAEFLAEQFRLQAARPHFQKLFDGKDTPVDRRLRAAEFLARTGDPRPLAPALKEMLRAGVGLGDGAREDARYETLMELLDLAGVDEDEIKEIARGDGDKR